MPIAGNHCLPPPKQRRDGVLGKHLASLVEDHNVKQRAISRNELTDGERACHPAGSQGKKDIRRFCQEASQGKMTSLLLGLAGDKRILLALCIPHSDHPLGVCAANTVHGQREAFSIETLKFLHDCVV
jgi:hypothetical protein